MSVPFSDPPQTGPSVGLVGDAGQTQPFAEALAQAGLSVTDTGPAEEAGRVASAVEIAVVTAAPSARVVAARAALEAGAHVFLAWPPSVSPEEAEGLLSLADESGVEVGVARPLPISGLLAGRPSGWSARLIALSLVAGRSGAMASIPWTHRLAGAIDLCAAFAGSPDLSRLDAQTERFQPASDEAQPEHGALSLGLRFRNGAFAQVLLRASGVEDADEVSLYASGSGARVEGRSLGGPLCVEPAPVGALGTPNDPDVVAFVRAVAARRPAPYGLEDALDTMRLVERVQARLR